MKKQQAFMIRFDGIYEVCPDLKSALYTAKGLVEATAAIVPKVPLKGIVALIYRITLGEESLGEENYIERISLVRGLRDQKHIYSEVERIYPKGVK